MKNLLCLLFVLIASSIAHAYVDSVSCVRDVREAFQKLDEKGSKLALHTGHLFPGRTFTQALVSRFGLDNHFQGIQRLSDGKTFVVSGADYWHRQGYLFVGQLRTKDTSGELKSNLNGLKIPKGDTFINRINVGTPAHWHAGGIGSLGDIVVVPCEDFKVTETATVYFYDLSDPERPRMIAPPLARRHTDAGTALLYKQGDGRYVTGFYTGGTLDFYTSKTTHIEDGFDDSKWVHFEEKDMTMEPGLARDLGGSSVNVVEQCDGQKFLMSFGNDGAQAPIINGRDYVDLYRFELTSSEAKIHKLERKFLNCKGDCNFSAAAGTYVDSKGELAIYSTRFFRNFFGGRLVFKEFWSRE